MVKCPNCEIDIEFLEELETETSLDGTRRKVKCYGACPLCGTDYEWAEIFKFEKAIDLTSY